MTDPQETSANVTALGSSAGDPDRSTGREDDPAHGQGSDVGGPAGATESMAEDALSGTSSAGADDPDDQATSGI